MEAIDILKALLAPTIAIIAVYIAFQQYLLAKQKQDIEVYDRRLAIYKKTIKLIRSTEEHDEISEEEYREWELSLFEAEYLFQKEVLEHLRYIDHIASDLLTIQFRLQEISNYQFNEKSEQYNSLKLLQWHSHALIVLTSLTGITIKVFSPYFSIIKSRHRVDNPKDVSKERENLNYMPLEFKEEFGEDIPF